MEIAKHESIEEADIIMAIKSISADRFPKPLDPYHMSKIADSKNKIDLKKIAQSSSNSTIRECIQFTNLRELPTAT